MDKQKVYVKDQPIAEMYIDVIKSKFYLKHEQIEKGYELLLETEKEIKKYR